MVRVRGYFLPALMAATFALSGVAEAAPGANGPAGPAAEQWFHTDRSLGCFSPQAQPSVCGPWIEHGLTVYYGGDANQDALAVVTYVNDPTGNAQSIAAASFHQDGGTFRFVKTISGLRGVGIAPGTAVRIVNGKATLTMLVQKPSDPRCCPTGRDTQTLTLR